MPENAEDSVDAVDDGDAGEQTEPDRSPPERWSASPAHAGLWMDPAEDPRYDEPDTDSEKAILVGYLRSYRLTLELKCAGLDAAQLARRSVPPSTMSLLGLIRHMAEVERIWFRRVMAGQDVPKRYDAPGEIDGDWNGAVADPEVVAEAWQAWREEVSLAERFVAGTDDLTIRGTMKDGSTASLRDILVHMIEEYARHCGHADLIRERVDGRVGQ